MPTTWDSGSTTWDVGIVGSGATCTPYLNDLLVGAFDVNHTGWELPEIFNAYAMLVNGSRPGGTVHFPTSVTAVDSVAFVGLIDLYHRNTTSARPSLLNQYQIPLHEWDIDPSHNSCSIENPMVKDTHARGAMWTETLAPTMYAAVEYGRYSSDYTWLENLYSLAREFTGLSGGSTHLHPTPRSSNGLMDAYTDMIGGEPLQANRSGAIDGSIYTVNSAQQIVIPASDYGGDVTWIRGAWFPAVPFRWDGFMADIDPDYVGDVKSYADVNSGASASNIYSGGILSTVIQLSSITAGSSLQVYYSYRDGTVTLPGQAIAGWPMLHVDSFQGTANDGDNYMMMSLYHAWRSTGEVKYKDMADRIGNALLDAGQWESNDIQFSMPFESEADQFGIYTYHGSNTPLQIDVSTITGARAARALRAQATVLTAQTPTNYAGFGMWPSWAITSTEPFSSFDFGLLWFGAGAYSEISYRAQQENAMWERQFLIGTSDYSSKVVRWPSISKVWNDINPKTVTIELSNEDRTFNFLASDPTKMRNEVSLSLGFELASMLTMFEGTIDAVRYNKGACSLTLVDKLRKLTDRKIGDSTSPVSYTASNYLVHDLAWYAMTSMGGLSAVANSSNPDIDYLSFSSWSGVFSIDNVRVQAHLTGQPPLDILRRLSQLTQSAIYDENGKIKFVRFTLASSPSFTLADSGTVDAQATLDDRELINRAAVSAAYNVDSQSFGITAIDLSSDSQVSYGLREEVVSENYVWLTDSVSALNLAQRMIVTNKNMQNKYSITTPLTSIGVEIGDAVVYQDSFLQVDDTFRVMGMTTDMQTGKKTIEIDRSQYFSAFYLDVSTLDSAAVLT